MPDASPVKWHLAHTTWFFETFLLGEFVSGYTPQFPQYRILFNSYYNAVGDKHPRPQRGLLTRPTLAEVMDYRRQVDEAMVAAIGDGAIGGTGFSRPSRARPEPRAAAPGADPHRRQAPAVLQSGRTRLLVTRAGAREDGARAGRFGERRRASDDAACRSGPSMAASSTVGHEGDGFCFDNELPAHQVLLQPFELARSVGDLRRIPGLRARRRLSASGVLVVARLGSRPGGGLDPAALLAEADAGAAGPRAAMRRSAHARARSRCSPSTGWQPLEPAPRSRT